MNFQQLRYVREAVRRGYNLTEVANALFTSQPGVSRHIRELEDELGVEIFERQGKRLTGLTAPGAEIARIVDRLLLEAENLKRAGREYQGLEEGRFVVATTHTQARYALPAVLVGFRAEFPDVHLRLQQSAPEHIAQMLLEGEADVGIATEALTRYPELVAFPAYRWRHVVLVRRDHPLAMARQPGLAEIAAHPIITYDPGFSGRGHVDEAFAREGLEIEVAITALDADVIKTYVEAGLGVGIVAAMAYDPARDRDLVIVDTGTRFPPSTSRLAVRRGAYLRGYAYRFIALAAPHLTRQVVDDALRGEPPRDDAFDLPVIEAGYDGAIATSQPIAA